MMIEFTIPGTPVAQGRVRFSTYGGIPRAYDPRKSRDYKTYVKQCSLPFRLPTLSESPVRLTVRIFRPIPGSFSKRKQLAALNGEIRPTSKPDVTNYVKGIEDALEGVFWRNDSQIVELITEKYYDADPRVEVRVQFLERVM